MTEKMTEGAKENSPKPMLQWWVAAVFLFALFAATQFLFYVWGARTPIDTVPAAPAKPIVAAGERGGEIGVTVMPGSGVRPMRYVAVVAPGGKYCEISGAFGFCTVGALDDQQEYTVTVSAFSERGSSAPSERSDPIKPTATRGGAGKGKDKAASSWPEIITPANAATASADAPPTENAGNCPPPAVKKKSHTVFPKPMVRPAAESCANSAAVAKSEAKLATLEKSLDDKADKSVIDGFKERLGDFGASIQYVGMLASLFGIVVTAIVIFFSLKFEERFEEKIRDSESRFEGRFEAAKALSENLDQYKKNFDHTEYFKNQIAKVIKVAPLIEDAIVKGDFGKRKEELEDVLGRINHLMPYAEIDTAESFVATVNMANTLSDKDLAAQLKQGVYDVFVLELEQIEAVISKNGEQT